MTKPCFTAFAVISLLLLTSLVTAQPTFGSEPQVSIYSENFDPSETLLTDYELWSAPGPSDNPPGDAVSTPGQWELKFVDGENVLQQSRNVFDNYIENPPVNTEVGTIAAFIPGRIWQDFTFTARFMSGDDDVLGVVFRHVDENNYYEFHWGADPFLEPSQPIERRIRRVCNGNFTDLALEIGTPYVIGRWYQVKVEVFHKRINVYLFDEVVDSDFVLWQTVEDSLLCNPVGTIGASSIANDQAYFDQFDVTVPYEALAALSAVDRQRSGSVTLGNSVMVDRIIGSQTYSVSSGIVSTYQLTIPAELAGQVLQLRSLLTGSSPECCVHLYISADAVPLTNNFDYAATSTRTKYNSITVPNVQAGTYYIRLVVDGDVDTATFDIDWAFEVVDAEDIDFETPVVKTGVPVNTWRFFRLPVLETYTGLTFTVTPSPLSATPYLRAVTARNAFPSLTLGDYTQLVTAPNGAGSYVVTESNPALNTFYLGVFVATDPDPASGTPVEPLALADFTLVVLPATPSLFSLTPVTGNTIGAYSLFIRGSNVGGNNYAGSTTVLFGGEPCDSQSFTEVQGEIDCVIPSGQGPNIEVTVTHFGQTSPDPLFFSFKAPSLFAISPATADTAGGSELVLSGTNFGTNRTVTVGGLDCPVVPLPQNPTQEDIDGQHSVLTCLTPRGQGVDKEVIVTVSGLVSTQQRLLDYNQPRLDSISPVTGPTAGNTIMTLRGNNFGSSGEITIGSDTDKCTDSATLGHNDTVILCRLPPGQGAGHDVTVTISSQDSNTIPFSYDKPAITSIDPEEGPTDGNFALTIYGTDFGTSGTVFVNGISGVCVQLAYFDTNITCTFPEGQGVGKTIRVSVTGQLSNIVTFDYAPPTLDRIVPAAGPAKGGTRVALYGSNFGSDATVNFPTGECTALTQNHTVILCTAPAGSGSLNNVTVSVDSLTSGFVNFAYDSPVVDQVAPANGPTVGSSLIVITGSNFGSSGAGLVTIDGKACTSVLSQYRDDRIVCSTPAGQGVGLDVVVTLNGQESSVAQFSYDAPNITKIEPTVVPTGGENTLLTITGENFGTTEVVPVVTILLPDGEVDCPLTAGTRGQPHTTIVCVLPEGSGQDVSVRVNVSGQAFDSATKISFAPPSISSAATSVPAYTDSQETLTILGSSFGTDGNVTVGGEPCVNTLWTHKEIRCTLPVGQGENQPVYVEFDGQRNEPAFEFDYVAPVVSAATPVEVPTVGGTVLEITGLSFGTSGSVEVDGRPCPQAPGTDWGHRAIYCVVPSGQGTAKSVVVTVGMQPSNNNVRINYGRPVIAELDPETGSTQGGYNLTVRGSSFGNEGDVSVFIGTTACEVLKQNHSEIVCVVPAGEGSRGVLVTVAERDSSSQVQFTYAAPSFTSVTPETGRTVGGAEVLIVGDSFGLRGSVSIGLFACAETAPRTHTQIRCSVPPGQGEDLDITVVVRTAGGVTTATSIFPDAFSYNAPTVTSVQPLTGPTDGQIPIVIRGFSFGDDDLALSAAGGEVTIGGALCEFDENDPTAYNHTEITCSLPAGQGLLRPLIVTVGGTRQTDPVFFNYSGPSVTGVLGPLGESQGGSTAGGDRITVQGSNFGSSGQVTVGGAECDITSYTSSQIICTIPEGQGTNVSVIVTVASQVSQRIGYRYAAPTISVTNGITPSEAATDAGTQGETLTIRGTNFGTNGSVTVGGLPCVFADGVSFYSHQRIECVIPDGEGDELDVVVTVSGTDEQQVTAASAFSYSSPTVSTVSPIRLFTNGSNVVQISGSNFGSPTANVVVKIGGAVCAALDPEVRTHSSIQCQAPAGVGTGLDVSVQVETLETIKTNAASYSAPTLTRLEGDLPCTLASNGLDLIECPKASSSTKLTLFGANFGSDEISASAKANITIEDENGDPVQCLDVQHAAGLAGHQQVTCTLPDERGFSRELRLIVGGQTSNARLVSFAGPVVTPNTLRFSGDAVPSDGAESLDLVIPADDTQGVNGGQLVQFDGKFLQISGGATPHVYYGPAGGDKFYNCTGVTVSGDCDTLCTIQCALAPGAGTDLRFVVFDGEQTSPESDDTLSYPQPIVDPNSITNPEVNEPKLKLVGTATQGETIYISATNVYNFTNDVINDRLRIFYGPDDEPKKFECQQIENRLYNFETKSTNLSCRTVPGEGSNLRFIIQAVGYDSERSQVLFSYPDAPVITKIEGCPTDLPELNSTTNCPTKGGVVITITGTELAATSSVRVGSADCTNVRSESSGTDKLSCLLPAGVGDPSSVVVFNGLAFFSRTSQLLSYARPQLSYMIGCDEEGPSISGCSRNGGETIVIVGTNFGEGVATVIIGGSLCEGVVHSTTAQHEELSCQLPKGTQLDRSVLVVQDQGELSSNTLSLSYEPCAAGTFSASDTDYNCTDCPAGKFGAAGSCTDCPSGRFTEEAGQTECDGCPRGKFSVGTACEPCGVGTFNQAVAQEECTPCPRGTYGPTTGRDVECLPCPLGRFTGDEGQTECQNCTAGEIAGSTRSTECVACNPGFFAQNASASVCEPCPAGTAAPLPGASECGECIPGRASSATGQSNCLPCDSGTFSDGFGEKSCEDCPVGKFSEQGSDASIGPTSCTPCPTSFFASQTGRQQCTPCPAGRFGDEEGLSECFPCLTGTKQNEAQRSECDPCEPGSFTAVNGSQTCTLCARGRYQPDGGKSECIACEPGKTQPNPGETDCLPCDPGTASNAEGQKRDTCPSCEDGSIATGEGETSCARCPAGFKAFLGISCEPCELGTFSSFEAQIECEPCPAGRFGNQLNLTQCEVCPAGKSSAEGALTCSGCPPGRFSEFDGTEDECRECGIGRFSNVWNSTTCDACPEGKSQSAEGQSDCDECDVGFFNTATGQQFCDECLPGRYSNVSETVDCILCEPGRYQPSQQQSECLPCPVGRFTSASGQDECQACSPGTFCAVEGLSTPTPCPPGQFSDAAVNIECTNCTAGRFTDSSGTAGVSGLNDCSACDVGRFNDQPGLDRCFDCPIGTRQPGTGLQACIECEAGKFQSATGQSECIVCPAGSITDTKRQSSCRECPAGTAAQGGLTCEDCDPGFFSSSNGSIVCTGCRSGRFSEESGATECTECPAGKKQSGIEADECEKCPTGRFGLTTGQSDCEACPAGRFANVTGLKECIECPIGKSGPGTGRRTCEVCTAGRFNQLPGQRDCQDCDPGTFSAEDGATDCEACPAGKAAQSQGSSECAPCGPGVFSAAPGALTCSPCDVGTFSNGTTNTECTKCSPGYEQPLSRSSKCLLCSPGTFAKFAGLQSCEDCPAGTFSAGDGAIECEDCEPGKFAGGEGLTECAKCPVGRAIGVSGQDECSRCTQGTFANRTGLAECLECPAGRAVNAIGRDTECPLCDATRFQSTPGQALCKLCPVGRAGGRQGLVECGLCQPGSFTDESGQLGCVLCPAGRFGNVEGARSCSPCPEGSFSTGEGNTECTPCDPGSFQDGEGEETCLQCPVGKFSVGSGAVSCSLCPRGSASPINGTNTLCPLCEPGKKAEQPGLGECTLCEAGKFADGTGRSTCDLCSPGTASDKPGSTEGCPACTAGKFQSFEGRTTCQPCPRGRFTNSTRTDVCSACDAGKYQDEEGQEQCVSCPRGKATARTGSTTDCQFCEPGRFTDVTGREECDFCDPGQVANVSGLFECKRCDVGRFQSRSGEEECEACPRGRFAAVPGLSLCAECPQGQYGNETNLISCLPCEPGTKSSSSGQTECEPCEVGKFSSGEGAKECLPCDPGESSPTPGAVRCTLCDPGRFQNERESETCKACPQGKFTSDRGRIECQDCASGEFTNTTGQSECTRCQPGEYSLLTACAPCPRGRFSALVIGTTCQPCGSGDFANVTGLSSCRECFAGFKTGDTLAAENCTTCEAGTSSNPGSVVCQVCDPGKFSNPVGLPYQCSDCPLNAAARPGVVNGVSRAGNTECVCNAGFFFDEAWRGVGGSELSCRECCRPCDEGADCSEAGRSFATLPARTGYWRASRFRATCPADNFDRSHACRSPPSFYRCLIRDHCPSTAVTALTGVFNVSNQCGGNRDGPICAVCEKGYHSPTTTGDCQECPENNTNAWVFTIIVTSVIVLCIIFMYWVVLKTDRNLSREAKERHHAHRENEWTWFEEDTANVTKSIHDKERVKYGAAPTALPNFTYKMKIVLGFFQITVNLAFALDIPWPSRYQSFISAFGLVNFDLIQWSSVGCVVEANFYHKFVAITVTPIIVLVLVFLFFLVPRYLRHVRDEEDYDLRRLARQRSNRKFWKLFLFTLFLIYPGVSSTVLRLYVCRDIEGVDYLLADFNIKCSGDTYDFFKQFNVIFIMLYPLGIPAFFFAMLYKNRDKLNLPDVRVQLGFLTDAYESVLWWFELVDMLNKLILTSLLAFVPRDFQLEMGCLFAVLYLIVLLLMRPYLRKGDDRLHLFAQTEIFLILLAGLVFIRIDSEDLDDGSDIIMSVILVSLTLGFLLYFFGQVGYILKKMWERSQAERRRKLEDDEQGVQLAPGVTQMRLPKNALMVRNPLFDNDSSSRMNDPMALETGGQWEGSQSEGSYFSEDSSVSSLTSGYSDAARDDAPQEGLKRPQSEETLMPEVAGMNEIETPDNSDYNDSSDAGDEPFKTEFAPRQIRRG